MTNNIAKLELETIATYNKNPKYYSGYFRQYSRQEDIDRMFEMAGNPMNPKVLEIGCGDGRDAEIISQRTNDYVGFDPSVGLVKIAQEHLPQVKFLVADAKNFHYPEGLDMVFAFASLLHVDIKGLKKVFKKLESALKTGGLVHISLKYSPQYQTEIKKDLVGARLFYLYNSKVIKELAGKNFPVVYLDENIKHGSSKNTWLEIVLKKHGSKA